VWMGMRGSMHPETDVPCVVLEPDAGPIELPLDTQVQVGRADVLFLIDVTASMGQEIDQIRANLRDRIVPGFKMRSRMHVWASQPSPIFRSRRVVIRATFLSVRFCPSPPKSNRVQGAVDALTWAAVAMSLKRKLKHCFIKHKNQDRLCSTTSNASTTRRVVTRRSATSVRYSSRKLKKLRPVSTIPAAAQTSQANSPPTSITALFWMAFFVSFSALGTSRISATRLPLTCLCEYENEGLLSILIRRTNFFCDRAVAWYRTMATTKTPADICPL
jgi:hypothetical protein